MLSILPLITRLNPLLSTYFPPHETRHISVYSLCGTIAQEAFVQGVARHD